MRFDDDLVKGNFLRRLNRFVCLVEVGGESVYAHLANSGRLRELLVEGRTAYLLERSGENRKTVYDLVLMRSQTGILVSMDARLPNRLFREYLMANKNGPFGNVENIQREVSRGSSRLDFLLGEGRNSCYVEVKSVTLVKDGIGLFPDGPTLRGAKHVQELTGLREEGYQAVVVFIVQRSDASAVKPNDETDRLFGTVLREAAGKGVGIFAFGCQVDESEIRISSRIPVIL